MQCLARVRRFKRNPHLPRKQLQAVDPPFTAIHDNAKEHDSEGCVHYDKRNETIRLGFVSPPLELLSPEGSALNTLPIADESPGNRLKVQSFAFPQRPRNYAFAASCMIVANL